MLPWINSIRRVHYRSSHEYLHVVTIQGEGKGETVKVFSYSRPREGETCGFFLRGGWSPSGDLPPLSIARGWPPGANGSLPCEWRRLQGFRVEDPSGARKGGPNRRQKWAGPAGLGQPAQAYFGPVRSPLRSRGSSVIMHFAPSTCMILTMSSSRPRWRFSVHEVRSFTLQSSGVFLRSTSVLATIGSDFIMLMNTNKTP
jgi:hypothetical protein